MSNLEKQTNSDDDKGRIPGKNIRETKEIYEKGIKAIIKKRREEALQLHQKRS